VHAYARSWFSNHEELFVPLRLDGKRELPRFDRVEDCRLLRSERVDAYADWFLTQLLARQIRRGTETLSILLSVRRRYLRLITSHLDHLNGHYGIDIFRDSWDSKCVKWTGILTIFEMGGGASPTAGPPACFSKPQCNRATLAEAGSGLDSLKLKISSIQVKFFQAAICSMI